MNEVSPMEEPTIERRAVATAEENSNFDQYSAIKQTKRLQNNLTGTLQSVHHTQTQSNTDDANRMPDDGNAGAADEQDGDQVSAEQPAAQEAVSPGSKQYDDDLEMDGPVGQQQEFGNMDVNAQAMA